MVQNYFKKIQFASIQHHENQMYFFPRVFAHPPGKKKKKNVSHHIISPVESSHPRVKPWLFASNLQGVALCLSKAWLKKHLKQTIGDIILDCYIFQQKKREFSSKKSKFLNCRNFWVQMIPPALNENHNHFFGDFLKNYEVRCGFPGFWSYNTTSLVRKSRINKIWLGILIKACEILPLQLGIMKSPYILQITKVSVIAQMFWKFSRDIL